MKEIKLPSGNTVKLRDPKSLKVKDRKKVLRAAGMEDTAVAQGLSVIDGLIAMMVEEWSFDLLPPSVDIKSLDELDIPDYDALSKEAESARNVLFPSFADDSDPDSPKDK